MKISRQIIIKMRTASDKSCRENQNTHSAVYYKIMWKNMVELDRSQMTTKYGAEKMQFACWIPKGERHTPTHTPPPNATTCPARTLWFSSPSCGCRVTDF
jgi:hypothetical protein